jgi:FKBP-type peptidyl-prolyl cis-trans isomerase SlyD
LVWGEWDKSCDNCLMKISPQCVVALTWTLKDTLGETLDVLDEPVEFLVGGDDLLNKIDDALQGHQAGDEMELHLEPEMAFGDYNDQLLFLELRHLFPTELEEGMVFDGLPAGCNPSAPKGLLYFVTEIYPEHVVLDGNHPLAGIAIRVHLKIHAVREATIDEVGKGSLGAGFFRWQIGSSQADPHEAHDHEHDHAHDHDGTHHHHAGAHYLH